MNLSSKIFYFFVAVSGLHLFGCRPEKPLLSGPEDVLIVEIGIPLNSERLSFQLADDSTVFLQNADLELIKYNPLTGKVQKKLIMNDSIRWHLLKETNRVFQDRIFFKNQDSVILSRKIDYMSKEIRVAKSYFYQDTLYIIGGYDFIGYLGPTVVINNKIIGYTVQHFTVLCKADRDMNVHRFFPLSQDTLTDINIGGSGHSFAVNKNRYYFPNGITFLMINPGGMQVRAYDESNNRFHHASSGSWLLPLSEELVKKMGYTDTTLRNAGKGDVFNYRMKTVNGNAFYSNGFGLYNLTTGKSVFDGLENDFRIETYTVDSSQQYIVLTHRDNDNSYSLRMYDKNKVLLREQPVPVEKDERVIQSDMNANKLVMIVQKNEKLYFKIYSVFL